MPQNIGLTLSCQQGWKFITTNILLSFSVVLKGFLNSKVSEKLLRGITIRENISKGGESFCRKHMPRLPRKRGRGSASSQGCAGNVHSISRFHFSCISCPNPLRIPGYLNACLLSPHPQYMQSRVMLSLAGIVLLELHLSSLLLLQVGISLPSLPACPNQFI